MSKHKIGARCLDEKEVRQILPTYDQIREQINFFRDDLSDSSIEKSKFQKINNIGIIGVRGAGKTSILKTIREELKNNNVENRDIILPIIIPENMSESGTLMSTILGMLGEEVKKREEEQKKGVKQKCRDIRLDSLRNIYVETIKQYTFIQKEYRDILIKEYTTENDYVNDCAKVFNSDTEFLNKFHELIKALLCSDLKREGLIFIFIDDIDLSTYRCAEIVKTLHSYLSNEYIVTFISGDLDTFEETLTLDFIRKDKVMDNVILKESILQRQEKTILASKQQLAYEYLKKIMPPMYRHNIKQWSLEEKGQYKILRETGELKNFSELLLLALEDWMDISFFCYREEGKIKSLPYTYHLFDNTSRGINNVYCVLEEIIEKKSRNKKEQDWQKEKKRLIDTIIASKPIYNQYRNDIQRKMFSIGEKQEDNKIFFDNAKAIIYNQEWNKYSINPVERFSLFVLVDFVTRILYGKKYQNKVKQDESYNTLKEKAMEDLFFYPIVAEKVIEYSEYRWNEVDSNEEVRLCDINKNFLLKGDFVFNLAYYKNINLTTIVPLYQKVTIKESIDLKCHVIIAMWKALTSISHFNKNNDFKYYYAICQEEFHYIQHQLSRSIAKNIIIWLFEEECEEIANENYQWDTAIDLLEVEQQCLKRLLLNRIAEFLKDETGEIQKELSNDIKNLTDELVGFPKALDRVKILKIIDQKELWKIKGVEFIISYLKNSIEAWIKNWINDLYNSTELGQELINVREIEGSWIKFFGSSDGVSKTRVKETKINITKILRTKSKKFNYKLDFNQYVHIVSELRKFLSNKKVWYGKYEAQELLNDLQDIVIDVKENGEKIEEKYNIFLLRCYMKYKIAIQDSEKINEYAELLKQITETLSNAHKDINEEILYHFIDVLNIELKDNIDKKELESLFLEEEGIE